MVHTAYLVIGQIQNDQIGVVFAYVCRKILNVRVFGDYSYGRS
jgi:hypothetical protein